MTTQDTNSTDSQQHNKSNLQLMPSWPQPSLQKQSNLWAALKLKMEKEEAKMLLETYQEISLRNPGCNKNSREGKLGLFSEK